MRRIGFALALALLSEPCAAEASSSYRTFFATRNVEIRPLGGETLVVAPEPSSAVIAVCGASAFDGRDRPAGAVATGSFDGPDTAVDGPAVREAERHGATLHVESLPDVRVVCIVAPPGAVEYAVSAVSAIAFARNERPRDLRSEAAEQRSPEPSPDETARVRARALSLEGATPAAQAMPRVLAVSGRVTVEAAVAVASHLAGAGSRASAAARTPTELHQSSERLSVMEATVHDRFVETGWAVPVKNDDDRAALSVALELLADGPRSRLFRLLVRERSLSHRVESWTGDAGDGVFAGVTFDLSSRSSVDRARRFFDGTVKQLRLVGPSRSEVDRARARLELDGLERWGDVRLRARDLALTELQTGAARAFAGRAASLDRVTPDAVRRVAHDGFVDQRRTTVEVYPPLYPYDDARVASHALYTVLAGDTLAGIAERFHVSIASIARANDLDPKYGLTPGQALWIPPK